MQTAAGRDSYRAAAAKLDALSTGGTGQRGSSGASEAELTGIADELLAVAGLLAGEPRLRRAFADPARSGEERAGLVRDLFAGKLGEPALDLLAELVGGRWSGATELLDGIERLGVAALLSAAERAGDLSEVEDELFRFGQVVDGSPELAASLADSTVPVDRRAGLVDDLLAGKARPATVALARFSLSGLGGRGFAASLSRLVELAAEKQDSQVAYVTAAAPLSDADEQRLATALGQMYGRAISVKVNVDPQIIGGLSVRVGSDLYDGTILRRLAQARTALSK
jgi:F-type H+-transporting ATPase subunit delta